MTSYEKCAHCWHFIQTNDADPRLVMPAGYGSVAEYVHLDNGEKEHDHDAEPSGDIRTLRMWEGMHPELFHTYADGMVGPNSTHFKPDYATAWDCADNCDTCFWLISTEALDQLGDDVIATKLRSHIASGHTLTSEEC